MVAQAGDAQEIPPEWLHMQIPFLELEPPACQLVRPSSRPLLCLPFRDAAIVWALYVLSR